MKRICSFLCLFLLSSSAYANSGSNSDELILICESDYVGLKGLKKTFRSTYVINTETKQVRYIPSAGSSQGSREGYVGLITPDYIFLRFDFVPEQGPTIAKRAQMEIVIDRYTLETRGLFSYKPDSKFPFHNEKGDPIFRIYPDNGGETNHRRCSVGDRFYF